MRVPEARIRKIQALPGGRGQPQAELLRIHRGPRRRRKE